MLFFHLFSIFHPLCFGRENRSSIRRLASASLMLSAEANQDNSEICLSLRQIITLLVLFRIYDAFLHKPYFSFLFFLCKNLNRILVNYTL